MGIQHTAEEKITIAKAICEQYATGLFTLESCAENQGIAIKTFNIWHNTIAEITSLYNDAKLKAKQAQITELRRASVTSLYKLVTGFETEQIEEYIEVDKRGKKILKSIKKTKKVVSPNVHAVAFALRATDPEQFKDGVTPQQVEEQVFKIGDKEIRF